MAGWDFQTDQYERVRKKEERKRQARTSELRAPSRLAKDIEMISGVCKKCKRKLRLYPFFVCESDRLDCSLGLTGKYPINFTFL